MNPIQINKLYNSETLKIRNKQHVLPNGFDEETYLNAYKKGFSVLNSCFFKFQYEIDGVDDVSPIYPQEYFENNNQKENIFHIIFDINIFYNKFLPDNFTFYIPKEILYKHINNECIIIFDMSFDKLIPVKNLSTECDLIANIIDNTVKKYNLNKQKCLILTCVDKKTDFLDIKTLTVNTAFIRSKDVISSDILTHTHSQEEINNNISQIKNLHRNYKFKFLNAKHRSHRFKLFEKIYNSDGLHDNYITYHLLLEKNKDSFIKKLTTNDSLQKILPYKNKDVGITNILNLTYSWEQSCDTDSYIEIVSESNFKEQYTFLTEKTARSIISFTPFIMLSSPYALDILKQKGFKTFDRWWDESYDTELDENKRIDKVFALFEQYNSYSKDQLHELINDMQDVLIHNYKRHIEYREQSLYLQECKKYFEKLNSDK